jgi:hypothetical protein
MATWEEPKHCAAQLADFDRLGVYFGHRRKLLKALAAGVPESDAAPATKVVIDNAERRQVTVMFSDLVGSTALSARMDPEDPREVISAYQKCVTDTVQRFGGVVAKYMGDGVLVYFGYPQAHEDDAERAVRSRLELIRAVGTLKSRGPLQTALGAKRASRSEAFPVFPTFPEAGSRHLALGYAFSGVVDFRNYVRAETENDVAELQESVTIRIVRSVLKVWSVATEERRPMI